MELYRDGKEWDEPTPRPPVITEEARITTMRAPFHGVPNGMVFLNGDLWVAEMGKLYCMDPKTGAVKTQHKIENLILDITTDGKLLYLMPGGWTVGQPIEVIEPATGKKVREIVTEENKKNKGYSAKGIAWVDGKLYVFDGFSGKLYDVDPQTGAILKTIEVKDRYLSALAFDGKNFLTGGRTELFWLDRTGAVARKIKVNYPLRSVAYYQGGVYLMEQPVFGFDKNHQRIQVWPRETLIYRLELDNPASTPAAPK